MNSVPEVVTEPSKRKCETCCILPQRYFTALMASIGVTLAYIIRNSVNAIIKLLVKGKTKKTVVSVCNLNASRTVKLHPAHYYSWDRKTQDAIKISFFWGYLISHLPGGFLSDQYGGKHVLGGAILVVAILNLAILFVIRYSGNTVLIIITKFLFGLAQGVIFPALHTIISSWTPARDLGGISGICFATTQFATLINDLLTFTLLKIMDWASIFYFYSGLACCWYLMWILLCYSNPTKNPFIDDKEKHYLHELLRGHIVYAKKKVPWFKLLTSIPVWMFVFLQIGHTWIWHSMISDMPGYMSTVIGLDIKTSHVYASLPYGIMGVCTISLGFLSDRLINRGMIIRHTTRQIFTTIGAMGPGVFMVGATFTNCNKTLVVGMFTMVMVLMSFYYAGTRIVGLDLAPNYSGIVMGLANGLGAIPGVVKPYVAEVLLSKKSASQWRSMFLISLSISAATNLGFIIFGNSDEQPWNQQTR